MTFLDIEISIDPSGLVLALLSDGRRLIHAIAGEGADPIADARLRALTWAAENHYLVMRPSLEVA